MPRKERVDEGRHSFEVEMTIPVNHTRRARSMEVRLGPAEPPRLRSRARASRTSRG